MRSLKRAIIFLVLISLVAYFVFINIQNFFYKTVLQENLVGVIVCLKPLNKHYDFSLYYIPFINGKRSGFSLFEMKGKEWMFEGEIIKWKKPLSYLGFKTINRPVGISDLRGTCYLLETQGNKLLFRLERILPIVDTDFISAVKQQYIPKVKFGIYSTNSGYLIRKIK